MRRRLRHRSCNEADGGREGSSEQYSARVQNATIPNAVHCGARLRGGRVLGISDFRRGVNTGCRRPAVMSTRETNFFGRPCGLGRLRLARR